MRSEPCRLALELTERATRSIEDTILFTSDDPVRFAEELGIDLHALQTQGAAYDLDAQDILYLNQHFGLSLETSRCDIQLRACGPLDELPYAIHTGRELRLMLAGSKPLAVFSDACSGVSDPSVFPEDAFDPHVAAGHLLRREYTELPTHPLPAMCKGMRVLMYARPGEEWRFDAWVAMRSVAAHSGWNESLERLEGMLLGYEHWQTEAFLRMQSQRCHAQS